MSPELKDKRTVYAGRRITLEVHTLQDPATERVFRREVVVHPGSVVVLPLLDEATVLLIRNTRYTTGGKLIELPAGTLEKGESPMNCAGRELQEETGYLARKLSPLGSFYASPGIITEKLHAFVARDLVATSANPDDGEEIDVLPTTWADALNMIRTGEIEDAKTIATLLRYQLLNKR